MIRRLLQFIAVLTILAATLNAQCALACAPAPEDHSCCKHHHSQKSDCSQLNVHAGDATLDVHRATPPMLAVVEEPQLPPAVVIESLTTENAQARPIHRPPSLTTLRI
jgi:hypothetical protein